MAGRLRYFLNLKVAWLQWFVSCRLIIPLMRQHGFTEIWITCNPDDHPSRRTCERLGAELIEIVDLPSDHEMYKSGDRRKCRYRLSVI